MARDPEIRTLRGEDLEQVWQLDSEAFHVAADRRDRFLRWAAPERFVGAFEGDRLVAQCAALPFGQFFGGRAVPMGGLSSVSVVPDRRGRGLARAVIAAALEDMRERGEVISSLFPATTRLSRGLGWELAGTIALRTVEPRALQALPEPSGIRVRPGGADDLPALRACYAECAAGVPGLLDRPAPWWGRLGESWRDRTIFAAEDAAGEVRGYLVYRQLDGEYTQLGGSFRLSVDELMARDRDASLALWRLLGSWAAQAELVHYRGPAEDPLLLLLPEQDVRVLTELRWMTRIVDAEGAVAARGYPPGLDLEAELELSDPLLPANGGRFVLSVRKGRGRLEPGGRGRLRLDAGAFASLYTGWAAPERLAGAGRLEGGTGSERAALAAAFAGPVPWIVEEF